MIERTALVTGAGRGIGRATAVLLAGRGIRVVGVSRTESELQALSRDCGAEYIVAGLESEKECQRVVAETRDRFGTIDILVNNAGISPPEQVVWELEPEAWLGAFAINLHAPFYLTMLTAGTMVDKGWGRIVNVASTAAQVQGIGRGTSSYAASKHALLGLTRVVALEVAANNVTCNAVLPGWVRTALAEAHAARDAARDGVTTEEIWDRYRKLYSAGRTVTPEEVANTIGFLVSDDASGVNGESVVVALEGRG